jgi:hypothetical protein
MAEIQQEELRMNEQTVQQEEVSIRTGLKAGDDSQIGSGNATPGSQMGTGSAVGSQMGSGH